MSPAQRNRKIIISASCRTLCFSATGEFSERGVKARLSPLQLGKTRHQSDDKIQSAERALGGGGSVSNKGDGSACVRTEAGSEAHLRRRRLRRSTRLDPNFSGSLLSFLFISFEEAWRGEGVGSPHGLRPFGAPPRDKEQEGGPAARKNLGVNRKAAAQGHQGALKFLAVLEAAEPPARMGPVGCANCGVLEPPGGAALKPCARYKISAYCGRECQKEHWKVPDGHKGHCPSVTN